MELLKSILPAVALWLSGKSNAEAVSADMNSSYTYSNLLDSRKDFVSYSLQPFISAIEDRLSMDDITARGNVVKFAINDTFLRQDPLQELLVIEKLLSLGLITVEQAMEMMMQIREMLFYRLYSLMKLYMDRI